MKLADFDYTLPPGLIAQFPLEKRTSARLLVIDRRARTITHRIFSQLNNFLPPQSCLVLNDSKVVHARLLGQRESGAEVEIFLLKKLKDGYTYEALLRPLKRLKEGERIVLGASALTATIMNKEKRLVRFPKKNIARELQRHGHIPLPPYIKRSDTPEDKTYYQTVYAKKDGSVAAPTAGLHFTKPMLGALKRSGHTLHHVTLHINYGTFKPVEVEDITQHVMHREEYAVKGSTYESLRRAKSKGQKIVAVGTTSCRVLETIAANNKLSGETDKFIYPGYQFNMVDVLLTNFHLPRSTLLMLVAAFAGHELLMRAYQEAIAQRYRFYSYGDAMLIV